MKKYILLSIILVLGIIFIAACSSAPASPTASADEVATAVFQRVYIPLTQTALAVPPTFTATLPPPPAPTDTPAPAGTPAAAKRPYTTAFAGCWKGPGSQYTLISNIAPKKYVTVLGVGNVPGWYVIRNPYFHNPCWIEAIYLKLDPQFDTSKLPVMTPAP